MSNQKIKPNRLESKEVKQLISDFPTVEIPKEIPLYNKNAYTLVGVGSTLDNKTGKTKSWVKVFTKTQSVWNRLKQHEKTAQSMANCHQMVILHNPTLKEDVEYISEKEFSKITKQVIDEMEVEHFESNGRLTDAKKEKLKSMAEEGLLLNDLAINEACKELNLSFDKVKEYIQSF